MKLDVRIGGRTRSVEIARENSRAAARGHLGLRIDGEEINADVAEVGAGAYSILLGGQALEARVQPAAAGGALVVTSGGREFSVQVIDPRVWRGRRGGALEIEGRQQIAAPMPGKVVRVLVAQGARVEAGQGLLVVEAMKMQNEVRSPKAGTLERLHVVEGQAVNAGEILAVVA